jgi:integrase
VKTGSRRHFGSVRQLPSGRYQVSYWHEGTRHLGDKTYKTKADALAYLSTVEADLVRGSWIDPRDRRMSVAELAASWLSSDPSKRPSTRARDEAIIRLHIAPPIGSATIASISRMRVQDLVNEWAMSAAAWTVHRQFNVLRAMFTYAVDNDLLSRSPCRRINLPAIDRGRRRTLRASDVAAIAMCIDERYRAMVWLGAVAGLRWAEVAGLDAGSVDTARGVIVVTQQLGRDGVLGPPKSASGQRTFSIPKPLIAMLGEHVACLESEKADDSELLFRSTVGSPLSYTNWRRRVWVPAVRLAGLEGVQFHDLRRAYATAMIFAGVDVKTAQTRLGHADPRMILATYAQATTYGDQAAAEKLGYHFFGPSDPAGDALETELTDSHEELEGSSPAN